MHYSKNEILIKQLNINTPNNNHFKIVLGCIQHQKSKYKDVTFWMTTPAYDLCVSLRAHALKTMMYKHGYLREFKSEPRNTPQPRKYPFLCCCYVTYIT